MSNHQKPKYKQASPDIRYFKELKKRVSTRINQLPSERLFYSRIKVLLLPLVYVILYMLALNQQNVLVFYLFYSLMGITVVSIFLNIIHEAAHKNIFRSKRMNRMAFYIFDLIGGNSYIWGKRHISLHHNFPNVSGWDSDIEQSGPIKIFPHGMPEPIQKFQHRFFVLVYPLYLVNWVLIRDFKDYFNRKQIVRKITEITPGEYVILFAGKAFFIGYTVIIPWQFHGFTLGQSITGFLVILITAGILGLVVLLTPHVNEGNEFPLADSSNAMKNSWFMHQLLTTNDVEGNNFFTRHLMGNFNYHLAHHLFPNISYVYAPEVTDEIRKLAEEYHLPYHSYSFSEALKKHYNLLKSNALASTGSKIELVESNPS